MGSGRRLLAIGAAAALAFGPAAAVSAPAARPQRIMSANVCTDLLLLQLAPRSRIASVTFLAHDAAEVLFPGADAGIPVNHGAAEDIARVRPDLIVTGLYTRPLARETARRVGAPLVEVKEAATFEDVRENLRRIGAAVGEPARAEALIRRMDAELTALAAARSGAPRRVVAWSGGTAAPGKDTMTNTIIETAGAVNVAALPGAKASTFEVEQLALARPDALLFGGAVAEQPSLARQAGRHRLVRRLYDGRRISFPEPAYTCGLPQSATAARDLRAALQTIPPLRRQP